MPRSRLDRGRRPDSLDALAALVFFTAFFLAVMAWTSRPAQLDEILSTRTPATTQIVGVHR